jgi:glutathione synthase/RimK-type ligase-like ATP-grasp enzyme
MPLCILGKEKTETNLALLHEAKKRFSSVFFVPMDGIAIGLHSSFSITYRTADLLKFSAVFARVPQQSYSYAYQLLSLFPRDTYMPVPPVAFLLSTERFFLLTTLRKRGIETLDLHMVRSVKAGERMLRSFDFPVVIRVPSQRTGVTVGSRMEAKSILEALASLKQPALIEDAVKGVVSAYVARPNVVAAVRKVTKDKDAVFGEGSYKPYSISAKARDLALRTAEALDAHTVRVDMTVRGTPKVVNIELNPNLIAPSRASGVNIPARVMESVHENYMLHQEKPALLKFLADAKSAVKDMFWER